MDGYGLKWMNIDENGLTILEMPGNLYVSDAAALAQKCQGGVTLGFRSQTAMHCWAGTN